MLNYKKLKEEYNEFKAAAADIVVDDRSLGELKSDIIAGEIYIELTSGFESSEAVVRLYNCRDEQTGEYRISEMKSYISIGSKISVSLGYIKKIKEVFRGFIARVQFLNTQEDGFCVEITAMDVKGIMMANSYVYRMKSGCYSDAVKEILDKPVYKNLKDRKVIGTLKIEDTPDKNKDTQLEMSWESDYDFIVRAAKKWGYEFFAEPETLYFRKGKKDREDLIELNAQEEILEWQISYDIRGLAETIEVRGLEYTTGNLIKAEEKFTNKISMGNKARGLISKTKKVYVDGSIESGEQARERAKALMDAMSYKFGCLEAECVGIPDLKPGKYMKIKGLGSPLDNRFYITGISHTLNGTKEYRTKITAVAAGINERKR